MLCIYLYKYIYTFFLSSRDVTLRRSFVSPEAFIVVLLSGFFRVEACGLSFFISICFFLFFFLFCWILQVKTERAADAGGT